MDGSPGQGSAATAAPGMGRNEVGPSPRSSLHDKVKTRARRGERGWGVGQEDELIATPATPCVQPWDLCVETSLQGERVPEGRVRKWLNLQLAKQS
jgi:hypothetical protein